MQEIKKFIVKCLTGKTFEFEFDINENIGLFRKNIGKNVPFTLTNQGECCIFSNDPDDVSVKKIIEITHPLLLLDKDILFYLTENIGRAKIRSGRLL